MKLASFDEHPAHTDIQREIMTATSSAGTMFDRHDAEFPWMDPSVQKVLGRILNVGFRQAFHDIAQDLHNVRINVFIGWSLHTRTLPSYCAPKG
jgi:hypothetical protein